MKRISVLWIFIFLTSFVFAQSLTPETSEIFRQAVIQSNSIPKYDMNANMPKTPLTLRATMTQLKDLEAKGEITRPKGISRGTKAVQTVPFRTGFESGYTAAGWGGSPIEFGSYGALEAYKLAYDGIGFMTITETTKGAGFNTGIFSPPIYLVKGKTYTMTFQYRGGSKTNSPYFELGYVPRSDPSIDPSIYDVQGIIADGYINNDTYDKFSMTWEQETTEYVCFLFWASADTPTDPTIIQAFMFDSFNIYCTSNGDIEYPTYSLSATPSPSAGGTITGLGNYQAGTPVTLTAIPNSNYTYKKWTYNGIDINKNSTDPVDASFTYVMPFSDITKLVAYFTAGSTPEYTLMLQANPANGGTVNGAGNYSSGSSVYVTATANTGFTFVNWTDGNGNIVSSNPNFLYTMPAATTTLTANYTGSAPTTYTLTLQANPANGGTVSGSGSYTATSSVYVSATVNTGFAFSAWKDGYGNTVSTQPNFYYSMPAENATLTAYYTTANQSYTLTLNANPANGGTVNGAGTYVSGSQVTITATPASGFIFSRWMDSYGNTVSTKANYTYIMPAGNVTLTAYFTQSVIDKYTLTLVTNPVGAGTVIGSGTYVGGVQVNISAIANNLFSFVKWIDEFGNTVSTDPNYTYTMPDKNVTLTAYFNGGGSEQYLLTLNVSPPEAGTAMGAGLFAPFIQVNINTWAVDNTWRFLYWKVGTGVTSRTSDFTFVMPRQNVSITAYYTKTTAIEENTIDGISIFPNPVIDYVNVVVNQNSMVRIMDISGRIVWTEQIYIGATPIDLTNYESGIYILQIINDSGKQVRKIVKQ